MSIELAHVSVSDERGASIELGSLWRERPVVLVFIRHFGCIHCRDHVAELLAARPDFERAGADVVLIGNGTPNFIGGFRDATKWTGALYTDPSLAAYRAAQLVRSVGATLDPRSLGKAARALFRGQRQGWQQGDQWQQGGVVVVDTAGTVRWHHASSRPGDNAQAAQILAALA